MVTGVFFGVPVIVVLVTVGGLLQVNELDGILKPWALYLGPLTGAVFGYYFGSSQADARPTGHGRIRRTTRTTDAGRTPCPAHVSAVPEPDQSL